MLCHELLHVQRRDWAWVLAEEAIRSVFWFHPAVWWVVARVQLAREEAVDHLAVLATGRRRAYVDALLAFADDAAGGPVAAFARERHLFRRIVRISREAAMSSRRVVVSCAVMALVVLAAGWVAGSRFPVAVAGAAQVTGDTPGPVERRAKPITPENPIPRRVQAVPPAYPAEAASIDMSATVTVRVVLDELGTTAEIRRLSISPTGFVPVGAAPPTSAQVAAAMEAIARAAVTAVRQWRYEAPADGPIAFDVTFAFRPGAEPQLLAHTGAAGPDIQFRGNTAGNAVPPPPPAPPPGPAPAWANDGIRPGGAVLAPPKTKHVNPVYPPLAQDAKVQGVVILEARIGPDGTVTHARVLRSIPLLDQAALDAVQQWEFTPTLLNGQPTPVIMTVTMQFTLT